MPQNFRQHFVPEHACTGIVLRTDTEKYLSRLSVMDKPLSTANMCSGSEHCQTNKCFSFKSRCQAANGPASVLAVEHTEKKLYCLQRPALGR